MKNNEQGQNFASRNLITNVTPLILNNFRENFDYAKLRSELSTRNIIQFKVLRQVKRLLKTEDLNIDGYLDGETNMNICLILKPSIMC